MPFLRLLVKLATVSRGLFRLRLLRTFSLVRLGLPQTMGSRHPVPNESADVLGRRNTSTVSIWLPVSANPRSALIARTFAQDVTHAAPEENAYVSDRSNCGPTRADCQVTTVSEQKREKGLLKTGRTDVSKYFSYLVRERRAAFIWTGSGKGPGCVKTQTPGPVAQQLNREDRVDESLLRRSAAS